MLQVMRFCIVCVPQVMETVAAEHISGAFDMNDMIKDSGIDHSVHSLPRIA